MLPEIITLKPDQVKVRDDLPRFRSDSPKVKELLQSIKKYGQLVPIIINRDNELIDGGRRLAACLLGSIHITCVYQDTIDELKMREMEFEANVQREDFTPADHALAIEELHNLKQSIYGERSHSTTDTSGWSMEDTAKLMGVSKANIADNLTIAKLIHHYPELKKLKTAREIKQAGKTIEGILIHAEGAKKYQEVIESGKAYAVDIKNMDMTEYLAGLEDESIDLLLTDPPYGIDIDKVAMNTGRKTGGEVSTAGFKFDDSKETMFNFIRILATESHRVGRSDAQAYVFLAPEFFHTTRQIFIDAGWNVHVRPLIWIKRTSGQNNMPERWPSSCYEMIMYARKEDAKLVKQGRPDWMQFDPIIGEKRHPTEKPVELLRELIQRSVRPGAVLLDPCCGSGSSLVAGLKEQLIVKGCDVLLESYNSACNYVAEILEEENEYE